MSTDRPPTGGPADDQTSPAAEKTPALPQVEPTQVIPTSEPTQPLSEVEPTRVIPTAEPTVAVDSWPSGQNTWPPPEQSQVAPGPPPFTSQGPFPAGQQPYPAAAPAYGRPNLAPPAYGPHPPPSQDFGQPYPPPTQPFDHPYPPPSQPFPTSTPQSGWQHRPQPGPYAGEQGFVGQPVPQGWAAPPGGSPGRWTAAPPQPLSGFPPPMVPQKRGHGWVVALVTVAAVVVVSLIAAFVVPTLSQLPARRGGPTSAPSATGGTPTTKPTGSPTPTAKPTPSTTPTMPSDPLVVLKKNPIYALKVPARCPYQGMPNNQASYRKQVGKLLACQNAAWKKALAPTAVEFSTPKVKFYSASFKSPCGRLGTTFPASYCTADSTLYFSSAAYAQGGYFRLSVASFVFHEYAHHVQNLAGLFEAMGAMKESSAVTKRRIELQAHCVSHYAFTVSRVGIASSDTRAIEYQWDYTSDAKGHGSTRAERYWGQRGLDAETIGACNTWSAKAAKVK